MNEGTPLYRTSSATQSFVRTTQSVTPFCKRADDVKVFVIRTPETKFVSSRNADFWFIQPHAGGEGCVREGP